jgi:glycosyltransferase involved in cell wall biosynthesis
VCSGPIWIFPLCHPKSVPDLEMEDKRSLDERNPRLRILTIGHINPNKRVDQIINAIGLRKELRDNVSYHVVGPIESVLLESYRRRVAELAIDVMFFGEVPDEVLDREIRNADVVVALRWPPLVAGSASVVEALWHGKPTIVTDVGCFRDLPDDVVVKVAPDDVDQLCAALMLLVDNRDRRAKLSARARAFATSEFSPERYAENVRKFCEVVLKKSFAMSAAVSMVRQLGRWGIPQDAGALKLLAEKWDVFT